MAEFILYIRPFSINSYHYATRKVKTVEAREWEATLDLLLSKITELDAMGDAWRKDGGCFHLYLEAVYPETLYYNKHAEISSRTIDITNFENLYRTVYSQRWV